MMGGRKAGDKMYVSWRDKTYYGYRPEEFFCPIRNQYNINSTSCPHHAAGGGLEMCTRMQWAKEGILEQKKDYEIDIHEIVKLCPPSSIEAETKCSLGNVMSHLREYGAGSTQSSEKVFKFSDYDRLKPNENLRDLYAMWNHVLLNGPVIASFVVRKDFLPHKKEIYLCEGPIVNLRKSKINRHAILVVGLGYDENHTPFWEYIETNYPYNYTFMKDGFGRIIATGIDKAFVPRV